MRRFSISLLISGSLTPKLSTHACTWLTQSLKALLMARTKPDTALGLSLSNLAETMTPLEYKSKPKSL